MLVQFFDKIKLHQYFLYTHLFVRWLGNLGLRVLIQVYFGVLHSQGFKFWAGNWLFLVPVWVLRPQSYQEASSLRGLVVGGERQLKAGLSCEVTIEHLEPKGTSTHLKQGEVDLCEGSSFKIEQLEYGGNSDLKIEQGESKGLSVCKIEQTSS